MVSLIRKNDNVQKYVLTLDNNSQVVYKVNQPLGALPDAEEKEGYNFVGWYVGEVLLTADSIYDFAGNVQATAKYQIKTYSINFVANDEIISTMTVDYDSSIILDDYPSIPQVVGYNGAWDIVFLNNIHENKTITVKYLINSFQIVYKDYDGSVMNTEYVGYEQNAQYNSIPTRTGYSFNGWSQLLQEVKENKVVTATYQINTYNVTYNDHDGTLLYNEIVEYGADVTYSAAPSRTGYTFSGWNNSVQMITENKTVVATYIINTYNVVYKDYDGKRLYTEVVNYNEDAVYNGVPTRIGYTFSSWIGIRTGINSNREVTASYSINNCQVSYKDYDGTLLFIEYVNYNADATYATIPTREGYTFLNWAGGSLQGITVNVAVKAEYIVNSYTIDIYDDATLHSSIKKDYNSEITLPTLSKYGYVFNGFTYAGTTYTNAFIITDNATLVSSYTKLPVYTLSYDCSGGELIESQNCISSYEVATLPTPVRTNYTFFGWYYGSSKVVAPFDYYYNCNVELVASWLAPESIFSTTIVDDKISITGLSSLNYDANLIVPSAISGRMVTGISDNAFSNNEIITSLTLPTTIKNVGNGAFSYMTNLESMHFNNDIQTYGTNILTGSSKIELIEITATTTFKIYYLFGGSKTNVPSTIEKIVYCYNELYPTYLRHNPSFFNNLNKPIVLVLNEGPLSISSYFFKNIPNIDEVIIPSTVRRFVSNAFSGSSIVRLYVPRTVTSLEYDCFSGTKLTSLVYAPDSQIIELTDYPGGGYSLADKVLPPNLQIIGGALPLNMSAITLVIPDSVTQIRAGAFLGSKIDKLYLGPNVEFIGKNGLSLSPVDQIHPTIYCKGSGTGENWDNEWKDEDTQVIWNYHPED